MTGWVGIELLLKSEPLAGQRLGLLQFLTGVAFGQTEKADMAIKVNFPYAGPSESSEALPSTCRPERNSIDSLFGFFLRTISAGQRKHCSNIDGEQRWITSRS